MLEDVFWKYFRNTGNINAFMARKELETNEEHESNNYTYLENYNENDDDYFSGDLK